jgi:uncharacterized protein YerC
MLRGNLAECSMSQLLTLVNLARKTGTLTVIAEQGGDVGATAPAVKRASLVFREGAPVWSSVDARSLFVRLYQAGRLNVKQAHLLQQRAGEATEKAQALLLLDGNYVAREDIMTSAQERLREDVLRVLAWRDGSFVFEENVVDLAECIPAQIDLTALLGEYNAHMQTLMRITEELPDLNARLRFAADVEYQLQGMDLSARAWQVVALIKPGVTIQALADQTGLDEFAIREVVIELLHASVIVMEKTSAKPAQRPARSVQTNGSVLTALQSSATSLLRRLGGDDNSNDVVHAS